MKILKSHQKLNLQQYRTRIKGNALTTHVKISLLTLRHDNNFKGKKTSLIILNPLPEVSRWIYDEAFCWEQHGARRDGGLSGWVGDLKQFFEKSDKTRNWRSAPLHVADQLM